MPQQSNTAIHRLLINRLVISAIVVSLLVSNLVIYNARDKVSEIAVDRSLRGALNISVLAADILNEPGLPRRHEMQILVNKLIPSRPNYATLQGAHEFRQGHVDS